MNWTYRVGRAFGRFVFFCTMRTHVTDPHFAERDGGYVLALTHLSHLEPLAAGIIGRRPIDWMTRKEFYKYRVFRWCLNGMNAFRVDRQGIPVSAVRTAIERVRQGRVVGICPEGGVKTGLESAFRGGAIKRGCCSVAIRSQSPIVPCLMLGPWLPYKRATIWVAYGEPIHVPPDTRSTRATRRELSARLTAAYQQLYAQLREKHGISDASVS
jgi:1-acyl-sn-glycerol-3-phosphate acyltransferase